MSAVRLLRNVDWTIAAVGVFSLLVTLALRALIRVLGIIAQETWWFDPLIISIVLTGYHFHKRYSAKGRVVFLGFVLAVIIIFQFDYLRIIYDKIQVIQEQAWEWDFQVFWLNGQVASAGQNFYIPENYYAAAEGLSPSDQFREQILDVGFWYPPQTMFLFLPLGWLSMQTAAVFWTLFLVLVLVADIFLLWHVFLPDSGLPGLALSGGMLSVIACTELVFILGQTAFILLFFILLFLRLKDSIIGGLWLVAAAFIKPFAIVLGVLVILRHKWRSLAIAIITTAVITVMSVFVFGPETFLTYLDNSPISKLPASVYFFPYNQSLLGFILRTIGVESVSQPVIFQPIFLLAASFLGVTTLLLTVLLRKEHDLWVVGLLLTFSLMVYPGTLDFYGLLLVIPFMGLWKHRQELPGGVWAVIAFISLEYLFLGMVEQYHDFVLLSVFLCWSVLVGISCRLIFVSRNSLLVRPAHI